MRIVLVDDHATVRKSLKKLIEMKGNYLVVGEGTNGQEAVSLVDELRPDLVLMDMNMPVMDGAEATRVIKERHPDIDVLALTAFADMSLVSAMVKAGASGYLLKGGSSDELLESLRAVAGGKGALDKEVTRGVIEDMAELYEKEQERAEALAELDRLKSEFVSVVSHELRTPITIIKGGALTLQQRGPDLDEQTKTHLLDSVVRQCERLTHMIGQILAVSGIQQENPAAVKFVSLASVAREAVARNARLAGGRKLVVHDGDALVRVNEDRLIEIAAALVENALRFTEGAVEISAAPIGSWSTLRVTDEGPGLDPEKLTALLDRPFSQGDSSATRRVGGLGLSLYMARQVLEALGGRLVCDTSPESGSTFTMELPGA
ncbi:MAG: response regulator [Actinomycetota bacterium]|nr:response regulator [Actinomycetota bacterium]